MKTYLTSQYAIYPESTYYLPFHIIVSRGASALPLSFLFLFTYVHSQYTVHHFLQHSRPVTTSSHRESALALQGHLRAHLTLRSSPQWSGSEVLSRSLSCFRSAAEIAMLNLQSAHGRLLTSKIGRDLAQGLQAPRRRRLAM
jgi:hypothetical protein